MWSQAHASSFTFCPFVCRLLVSFKGTDTTFNSPGAVSGRCEPQQARCDAADKRVCSEQPLPEPHAAGETYLPCDATTPDIYTRGAFVAIPHPVCHVPHVVFHVSFTDAANRQEISPEQSGWRASERASAAHCIWRHKAAAACKNPP